MDRSFWRGRSVFITGHTGFKGSWLSLWLQHLGARVTGYALAPATTPSLFDLAGVGSGMTSFIGDVCDREGLEQALTDSQPEIVIHMAAQALVRPSYDDPVGTYATNIMGTVNLLDAIRQVQSVRAVVNVTSDKCYENREWDRAYREDDAMGGYDPYSSSKGCAELVTAAYRNSFFPASGYANHGVAIASARAGNVIGGGDWSPDRLVPDILTAIQQGQPVKIRNPAAIRPWQHVLEPLGGYLTLCEALYHHGSAFAEGWNFGPAEADARPVEWIVRKLFELSDLEADIEIDAHSHPHEAHYLKLDCAKAEQRLNWKPCWTLEKALQKIVEWQKDGLEAGKARQACKEQIASYEAALE